jgi:hypothetical protein
VECGLKKISQSLYSMIRKKHFSDYQVKRRVDGFARCRRCDNLAKHCQLHAYGSAGWRHVTLLLESHLREQECTRAHYCFSRAISIHRPLQVLSIMHDKMDHSKTASPCFASKTKSVDGFMKLPISVIGIFAHGHGDKKYAHYVLDLYAADSNQTVGSIEKLLQDLERPSKSSNPGSLFGHYRALRCTFSRIGGLHLQHSEETVS